MLHIVLVEDSKHDRVIFRRAFRNSAAQVRITEYVRAEEALNVLRNWLFYRSWVGTFSGKGIESRSERLYYQSAGQAYSDGQGTTFHLIFPRI